MFKLINPQPVGAAWYDLDFSEIISGRDLVDYILEDSNENEYWGLFHIVDSQENEYYQGYGYGQIRDFADIPNQISLDKDFLEEKIKRGKIYIKGNQKDFHLVLGEI